MATARRVHEALHKRLRGIADAVTRYEREKFWRERHEAYTRLREGPEAWKEYQEKVALLDGGSLDDLEDEEPSHTPEEEEGIRAEAP